MRVHITLTGKHLIILFLIALATAGTSDVAAYLSDNPSYLGHTIDEIMCGAARCDADSDSVIDQAEYAASAGSASTAGNLAAGTYDWNTDAARTVNADYASAAGSATAASSLSCADCIGGPEIDEGSLSCQAITGSASLCDGNDAGITSETDPTVISSVKDGIAWSEISGRPAGLDDGDQVGITSEEDPQVGSVETAGRWCRATGSQVTCDQSAPVASCSSCRGARLYNKPAVCGGGVTTSSTCKTIGCSTYYGSTMYYTCSGQCSSGYSQTCSNSFIGYLCS